MKREIKFKFWLGHTKKMTYEHSLIDISHAAWDFTEDIIPIQFTGIKDKNGKDVYEGDILRIVTESGYYEIGQVIYKEITARYGFLSPDGSVYGLHTHDPRNEIIGNIYENPELLNQ
jgi:uncharacterized phage protein (TIGR01671 family)